MGVETESDYQHLKERIREKVRAEAEAVDHGGFRSCDQVPVNPRRVVKAQRVPETVIGVSDLNFCLSNVELTLGNRPLRSTRSAKNQQSSSEWSCEASLGTFLDQSEARVTSDLNASSCGSATCYLISQII